jgi:hypothetical protein
MFDVDLIRSRQEQRLMQLRKAWHDAKKHLEEAIALTEAREREFREASLEVQRRFEALDLVVSMAKELNGPSVEVPEERAIHAADNQPKLNPPDHPADTFKAIQNAVPPPPEVKVGAPEFLEFDGLVKKSSRQLFPPQQRAKHSLSILQ